jgi:hypothetical protein
LAAARGTERGPLVREAERDARALGREGAPWSAAVGQLLEAGVATGRGEAGRAAALLREAAGRCDSAGLHLHAAAARRRLGALAVSDEGAALAADADRWMASQGVVRPERMAALLVPLGTETE